VGNNKTHRQEIHLVTKVTDIEFFNSICQNQDPVLNETAELLGLSLRMTEDQLTRDMLASTAGFINCTGGTNGDLPTNLSLSDIDNVTQALLSNDAWMILDNVQGEDRFGTGPVRDSYLALGHTDLAKDLNNINGFISKWNYPNQNTTLRSEWGTVNNVRFMLSSVGSKVPNASALGNTVYNTFIQGMESLACVEQDNFSARFLYRPPVFSDPLFQNVTIGYVFAEVPRILNDLWIYNLRSTLSS
jgi:N4-gp56 family major capsid protein